MLSVSSPPALPKGHGSPAANHSATGSNWIMRPASSRLVNGLPGDLCIHDGIQVLRQDLPPNTALLLLLNAVVG